MAGENFPRSMSTEERAILDAILIDGLPEVQILRIQAASARVAGRWTSDSPSIDFTYEGANIMRADIDDGVVPADVEVQDSGGNYIGGIVLWVENGLLGSLEYYWTTEGPPTHLPTPSDLRVTISDEDLLSLSGMSEVFPCATNKEVVDVDD